jgi:hypothetical protein
LPTRGVNDTLFSTEISFPLNDNKPIPWRGMGLSETI